MAAALLVLGGVTACGNWGQPSASSANVSQVKAKGTEWVRQDNDTWLLVYLFILANNQQVRVSQSAWNSAIPGTSYTTYTSSYKSVSTADPEEDTEVADTEAADIQQYDSEVDAEEDITNDDTTEFDEADDDAGDDADITPLITARWEAGQRAQVFT